MAIPAARRRADGDEDGIGIADGAGRIGREEETLFLDILGDQAVEAGLIDRHDAVFELLDLAGILVDAGHRMAEIGETGAGNEADIAGTDDRNTHGIPSTLTKRGRHARRAFFRPENQGEIAAGKGALDSGRRIEKDQNMNMRSG